MSENGQATEQVGLPSLLCLRALDIKSLVHIDLTDW